MALGAQREDILAMVLRQGLVPTAAGLGVGLLIALAATRLLEGMLFGVAPVDPLTFAVLSAVLFGVAAAACYVPARRAARVDPLVALKHE